MLYTVSSDPTQPTQLVFAARRRGKPTFTQTISNRDPVNTLLLAVAEPRQIPDFTANLVISVVDPLQSYVVDGTEDVFGVALSGNSPSSNAPAANSPGNNAGAPAPPELFTIMVDVVPTASGTSGSPLAIATAIVQSGLALAIAKQIAQSGLSLIAQPSLLYSIPAVATPGTLVGATIGAQNYSGQTQAQADTTFDGFMSRPMAVTAQKIYCSNEGQSGPDSPANTTAVIGQGAAIYISIKPAHTASNTYADATVTVVGTTCLQEKTNLTNIINNLLGQGLTTTTLKVTLWQEPNNSTGFDTAAHYQAYLTYYATAVRALGISLVYNPLVGGGNNWNAVTGYPGDALCDEVYADFYGSAFNTGYTIDGTGANDQGSLQALADNHLPSPVPFGLGEFNDVAGPGQGSPSYWANYMTYLQNLFQARINASKPLGWLLFWMGNHSTTKPNNQILSASDFKIPALQQFYDSFSQITSQQVIGNGQTVTLPALAPAPGGQAAIANALGYELTCTFVAGAASTNPFATIQMQWYPTNNFSAPPIAQQYWTVPMGANGTTGTITYGKGPQYGAYLRVNVHNLDTVACVMTFQLNSNGRNIMRDDWIWDVGASVNIPAFTVGGAAVNLAGTTAIAGNQVGMLSAVTVAAGATNAHLFGLFSGQVFVRFFCATAAGKMQYQLFPQPASRWGASAILDESPSTEFEDIIILPRGPCVLLVTNNDTVSHQFSAEVTAYD